MPKNTQTIRTDSGRNGKPEETLTNKEMEIVI